MHRSLRHFCEVKYHLLNLIIPKRFLLKHSINHILNKKVLDRYLRLPLPFNKVLATYIWIDGSGINLRCKDRVLNCVPCCADAAPTWTFDGSSTGQAPVGDSDTTLKPVAVYRDPFRASHHVLVLCEVYKGGGKEPVPTNHRKYCNDLCQIHECEEPWFGLEQECTFLDVDGWGLGWPKGGGFPAFKYQYSYCGVGAKHVVGRDISEAHEKACLYAGLDFEGTNSEVMYGCWEWQIGTSLGIKAADDLWTSRFIMARVAEDYGVDVTYNPKPMGLMHPGVGMHHNFSTIRMRSEGGMKYIEEYIKKLEANHSKHMKQYGNDEVTNRMRMSGKFETAPFDKFSWGVASRTSSIRLQRSTKEKGRGFMEDRRPAGDCDPYLVCGLLLETCLGTKALTPPCKPPSPCSPSPNQSSSPCEATKK